MDELSCFEVEIAEDQIRNFEWLEDGKSYREWLVPAEVLNACATRELPESEAWEIAR
jgi:hypothetical protein